jgi:hypothetical protein
MYAAPRHEPKGRSRSERLARRGAILVWSSIAVGLLTMIIFFSFSIGGAADSLTEDDFTFEGEREWSANVDISDFGSLTATINSKDEELDIIVTLYDWSGYEEDSLSGRTPMTFSSQVFSGGEYQLVIEIEDEGKTIDDLEVQVSTTSTNMLLICCGTTGMGMVVIGLFITGFVMLMVAISQRKRERAPPRPMYRYPPPPSRGYYGRPPNYQVYQPPPQYYRDHYMGHQTEGYLGYEGPQQGYYDRPPQHDRRYRQW